MMARKYANLSSSRSEYARTLPNIKGGFRGVDLSHAPHQCEAYRLAEVRNMWRDYRSDEGGALETIPGFRRLHGFPGKINGIHRFDDADGVTHLAVHAGTKLYVCPESERDSANFTEIAGDIADRPSRSFVYNGVLYLLDGVRYRCVVRDGTGYAVRAVRDDAYVPKLFVHGEQLEQRNMLTDRYRVTEQGVGGVEILERTVSDVERDSDGNYVGKNSFVFTGANGDGKYYTGDSVECIHLGDNSLIKAGGKNAKAVVLGNAETYDFINFVSVSKGAFDGMTSLEKIYFCTYKPVLFDENDRIQMRNGGNLFFKDQFGVNFQSGISGGVNYLEKSLCVLPPNVVAEQGQTVGVNDINAFLPYSTHEVVSSCVKWYNELPLDEKGNIYIDPSKIHVHRSYELHDGVPVYKDEISITVGSSVSPGRYVYLDLCRPFGNAWTSANLKHYRIEVVAKGETDKPVPVTDVFGYDARPMKFQLPERTLQVHSVKDEGIDAGFGCFYDDEGYITEIGAIVRAEENEVEISATAADYHFKASAKSFYAENSTYVGTGEDAIDGCTLCCVYDDRVFLAGNPNLPNTLFYSNRNDSGVSDPSYFGVLNYVNDGTGWDPINALFTFSDTLCATKNSTVYYHQGADGADLVTRVYPSVRGNVGLGSLGAVCCFLDDPVMLTREGVWGVNKENLTLERTLGRRSSTVDAGLLQENNLANASMVEWEGYLCLFVDGNVYMADSRATYTDATGGVQYEWFLLSGVGLWKDNGKQVPVYASVSGDLTVGGENVEGRLILASDGEQYKIVAADREIEANESEVYTSSLELSSGESVQIAYVLRDGKAIPMAKTGECAKVGTFLPARHPVVICGHLYFGTGDGDLLVFNTDKRGVTVGEEEMPAGAIHRSYYTFAGHRIDSGFVTRADDCDAPHLCKTTSPRSLTIRAKLLDHSGCDVYVITERAGSWCDKLDAPPFSFGALDFTSVSFYTGKNAVIVGKEKEKRWVEKQYVFRDGGFARPFGVYSIAYRYRIAGRIRE